MTLQSDVAPLRRALLRHARDAFLDSASITSQWEGLGYLEPPEFEAACAESDALASLLGELGVRVEWLTGADTGLDSIYARDASLLCDRGAVLCRMGKEARGREPESSGVAYAGLGLPVHGEIVAPGTVEGGDAVWLGPGAIAVGRGYRTNDEGIRQLEMLLGPDIEVITVPLPHWRGPGDVFHLMSIISPLAADLALVYSPLMPVAFRELLLTRGIDFVEVPDEELGTMGCNVLAVAPRRAVALEGNPETRRRLEAAGVEVCTYVGDEISRKGCGGPTCLVRALERDA